MNDAMIQRMSSDIRQLQQRVDRLADAVKELQSVYSELLQLERVANVGDDNGAQSEQSL